MINISEDSKEKIRKTSVSLDVLYNQVPSTKGCLENINHASAPCRAWCCQLQNPQVVLSEFSNAWLHIYENWEEYQIFELIERSVRNYLSNKPIKGCVFWNKENMLCNIHEKRPLNCRMYGIIPKKEFSERFLKVKEKHPDADIRDQCDLVSTEDGSEVTLEMTNKWFEELRNIEISFGVDAKNITDKPGGTYRTFHDHILLNVFPEKVLQILSQIKTTEKEDKKESFIKIFMENLRSVVKEINSKSIDDGKKNQEEQKG